MSEIENPQLLNTLNTHANFTISGNCLILSTGGIQILNIENPAEPEELCRIELDNVRDFATNDTFLYVIADNNLVVYNLANPAEPVEIASLNIGSGQFLFPDGTVIIVTGYSLDFITVNIEEPTEPVVTGRMTAEGGIIRNVTLADDKLFITRSYSNIESVDVSNPREPRVLGMLNIPGSGIKGLKYTGGLLCAISVNRIYVIDSGRPDSMFVCGTFDMPQGAFIEDMDCAPGFAIIVTGYTTNIIILADPEHPTLSATIDRGGDYIRIKDKLAYVFDGYDISVYDVSIPSSPMLVKSHETGSYRSGGFDVFNGWCCYIDFYDWGPHGEAYDVNLRMIDISGHQPPRQGRSVRFPSTRDTRILGMENSIAFIAIEGSLAVWELQTPYSMQEFYNFRTPGFPCDITIKGTTVYLADGSNLGIYDGADFLATPSDPSPVIPQLLSLSAFPNPFNTQTTIEYQIIRKGDVKLKVFDVSGRQIGTLVNFNQPSGLRRITLDGENLPAGTYLCRLNAGGEVLTKKLVLVK